MEDGVEGVDEGDGKDVYAWVWFSWFGRVWGRVIEEDGGKLVPCIEHETGTGGVPDLGSFT